MKTFNIYVRSYNRYDNVMTSELVEYCTYVVRASQADLYKAKGVKVLAVEDRFIDSGAKVLNWLIENAEEDVIAVLDDDIKRFKYRLDKYDLNLSKEQATREIERLGQLISDLDIGYATIAGHGNLLYYDRPFRFVGVNAGLKIFNRAKVVGRFDSSIRFLYDDDFQFQELLTNRIALICEYFLCDSFIDTNGGGNNDDKTKAEFQYNHDELKRRWGKYYKKPSKYGGSGSLLVKR